ncbi:MAG: hypothetical protein JWR10_4756 [Rubritepida sp.]|nr:hypothetical protein [Rubritepida sp.]
MVQKGPRGRIMGSLFTGRHQQIPASDWPAALLAMPEGGVAVFSPAQGSFAGRRIARALLEEAAVLGGGHVVEFPGGDLLLGATTGPGNRARQAIAELTGQTAESWPLPANRSAVKARCEQAQAASAALLPTLAGLEAHCATLPVEDLACLTFFADGTGTRPVAQRLGPASLGLADAESEAVAREWLCRRLLAALADPVQRRRLPALRPGLRLILDLPLGGLPRGAPLAGGAPDDPNRPIALLPLASLADPGGFAAMEAGLRAAGWAVGLVATDACALDWVEAPGLVWAVPATAEPPAHRPPRLIALGQPTPGWCRAPGILHEGTSP